MADKRFTIDDLAEAMVTRAYAKSQAVGRATDLAVQRGKIEELEKQEAAAHAELAKADAKIHMIMHDIVRK